MTTHPEHEDHGWTITIPGHAPRADSKRYTHSRAVLKQLVAASYPNVYGAGNSDDHHGGALWFWEKDDPTAQKPCFVRNLVGIEWSAQFCADPVKIDSLRQNAARFYAMFPQSVARLDRLKTDATLLLSRQIIDETGVADWVDSIFNASVPLPAPVHTGVLPAGGGIHHYPQPIVDISFFKHDDFQLWVDDGHGTQVAVVPVAPRGSGNGDVALAYVPPQGALHAAYDAARSQGKLLVLPANHPIAKTAFQQQGPA